jgi:hypothetical protein
MTTNSSKPELSAAQKNFVYTYRAIYAVGGLSLFLGSLGGISALYGNLTPAIFLTSILFFMFGGLYIFLGVLVQRHRSFVALGVAAALMLLNFIVGVFVAIERGTPFSVMIPGLFLWQAYQGFKAIQELNAKH